jgi:surfeit locus 1 family protein
VFAVSSRLRFWIVALTAALSCVLALNLGVWQLKRAAQKQAWVTSIQTQGAMPELSGTDWSSLQTSQAVADTALHRLIRLQGTWLQAHVVFLDNRQMNSKPGFYVITPLRLNNGEVVVVQRGWVQRDFMQREQVPDVRTSNATVTVLGRLAPPPSQLYSWDNTQLTQIRQNLNWSEFADEVGSPIGLLSVAELDETRQTDGVANDAVSDGLLRQWPAVDAKLHTHYGYAVQWFALALLVAFLYIWFQWIAPRRVKQAHS